MRTPYSSFSVSIRASERSREKDATEKDTGWQYVEWILLQAYFLDFICDSRLNSEEDSLYFNVHRRKRLIALIGILVENG